MPIRSSATASIPKSFVEVTRNDPDSLLNAINNLKDDYIIKVPKGSIDLTGLGELLFTGDGTEPSKTFIIEGSGLKDCEIIQDDNAHLIHLINGASVFFKDLKLTALTAGTPLAAIFGDDGGGATVQCATKFGLRNIDLRGGIATQPLIHLQNPNRMVWDGTTYISKSGAGESVIKIENTDVAPRGDSHWGGYFHVWMNAINQKAIEYLATSEYNTLMKVDAMINIDTSSAGCSGLVADKLHNSYFNSIQIEHCLTPVILSNCKNVLLRSPFIMGLDTGTIFDIAASCQGIQLFDILQMMIQNAATVKVLNDLCTSNNFPTICHNWRIYTGGGGAAITWTTQTQTIRKLIRGDFGKSENAGIATILNGNTNIDVAHGLLETPQQIRVLGFVPAASIADVSRLIADSGNIGAANFRIESQVAVGANRDVMWDASVNLQAI